MWGSSDDLDYFRRTPFRNRWDTRRIPQDNGCYDPAVVGDADLAEGRAVADIGPQSDPAGTQSPGHGRKHEIGDSQATVHVQRELIARADNVDQAGGVVKYVELLVAQRGFLLFQG